ncbi:hypothetical protein A6X21_05050 [Planctopirus hydrillae]|uniref:Uncharacterized protein n=1 Tax=Planctopirus hydrillae TaxID=1841610 RepID=A0A1C3EIS5_9PLAN|nr:hypothetical protein A6X21_05050 [Planctopirus hydrillae]
MLDFTELLLTCDVTWKNEKKFDNNEGPSNKSETASLLKSLMRILRERFYAFFQFSYRSTNPSEASQIKNLTGP